MYSEKRKSRYTAENRDWKLQRVADNGYYNTYVPNDLVEENVFLDSAMEKQDLPVYEQVKDRLPNPYWEHHDDEVACYWKAWELAFGHLLQPNERNGFISNYIDTAFNDCLFMWDSCFIMMFGKYGHRVFPFQRTLDNFYCKQHPDGFICRQIAETDGKDRFHRFDPTSTGPNIFAWAEWEYFSLTGDRERLRKVFPVLTAYYQWLRAYRTWPDGTYWASGWGGGLDNQPRMPENWPYQAEEFYHGHQVWLCTCLQQIMSAKQLISMAEILGRADELEDVAEEAQRLTRYVNEVLWDDTTGFYYDLQRNNSWLEMKSISTFWALLADVADENKVERLIDHLENPQEFKRPHRVPSLSADHPRYKEHGEYWVGSVWTPTNYMVLRGLTKTGHDSLAHEIALNHLNHVVEVFKQTGTIWENYAPESSERGQPSKPDFVGWSGLAPITVLLEYVFGLRADVPNSRLVWDVRLLDKHGVESYPFGNHGELKLLCDARKCSTDKPLIHASSNIALELVVRWDGGEDIIRLIPS